MKKVISLVLVLAVLAISSLVPLTAGWLRYSEYIYYECPAGAGCYNDCTIGEPTGCIPTGCG